MIGTLCLTALNVYWNMPPILGPCDTIPTAELAARIHELNICQASILSPALLQEMVENHDQLQGLGRLKHLIWVGSPFTSAAVPEKIRSYVTIYPAYGATEAGPLQLQMEEQEFHEYMSFGPLVGATFRHYSEDLYELVLVKQPKIEAAQFVFFTFPKLLEWPSRDLFSKHPTKPIWRYRGRSDDTIVMANGLKINPLVMEGIVSSHPRVVFALLTIDGQSQVAWLIEVRDPPVCDDDIACLLEDIWPTVETANEIGPIHARVPKGAVVFVTKAKPMFRAGKGTVQRKITIDAYQAELSKAYKVANPNRSILPT
jgi:acyl-coenzyme A synthetase/AMP-(fatty) acid ligase